MSTDLSYILLYSQTDKNYLNTRLGNEISEIVDGNFLIKRTDSNNVRVIYIHKEHGIVSGVHYHIDNGIGKVKGMYTEGNHKGKGYFRKVLRYANSIDGKLSIGKDLTISGEKFVKSLKLFNEKSNYFNEKNEQSHSISTKRNILYLEFLSSMIPINGFSKEKRKIAITKMKSLKEQIKYYDELKLN